MKTSIVHIFLTSLIILMIVLICSSIVINIEFKENKQALTEMLTTDNSQYFLQNTEQIYFNYNGDLQPITVSYLSDDYKTMYNSNSFLIIEAPEEICDTYYEQCLVYNFNPFGINVLKQQEIIRKEKMEE